MVNDTISDMLTRIRNANMVKHQIVQIPLTKISFAITEILKQEGYIEDFQILPEKPRAIIQIKLKYVGGRRERRSVITGLERVSRPGRRVYVGKQEIPWVLSGMGVAVLTTSKGIRTGQKARRLGLGGEVLCKVW